MPELTKADMDELLQKQAKTFAGLVQKGSGPGPGSSGDNFSTSTGRFSSSVTDAADALNPLTKGFDMLGAMGSKVFSSFKEIYNATNENIGMMQTLSKSGMNFSGDVVGMTASMKGMRLSNEEFADVMTKNAAGFTAIGGNATRGAEAFAKLSREFMSSPFIDQLNAAGFTNKELNDLLALQVTTGKMALRDDKKSRELAIDSARKLAEEMDKTAKLTGKSREEQMSAQQKLKDDMAIEAKLRMETAGMAPEEARKYRDTVFKQIAQAELEGRGQLLKEQFIHGQAVSEQAIMQQQTMGDAAYAATVKQGDLLRAKQLEQADVQAKEARRAAVTFGESAQGFFIATMVGNDDMKKQNHETMKSMQGFRDSLAAIAQEEKFRGATIDVLEKEAERRAEEARVGKNKEGETVNQTTETMIKLKNRAGDVESAFYNNLVVPLNRDIGKTMRQMNETFLAPSLRRPGTIDNISYEKAIGEGMDIGRERAKAKPQNMEREEESQYKAATQRQIAENLAGLGLRLSEVHQKALMTAGTVFHKAAEGVKTTGSDLIRMNRSTGSLGMTGNLIEDFGQGTLAMLHGKESVITEQQLNQLASGMKQSGVVDVINNLTSSVKKTNAGDIKDTSAQMKNNTGLSDMINRMNYTVSSKATANDAINLQMPSNLKDMKVNPDEITKVTQAMMSQMEGYRNTVEQKSVAKKAPTSATESASDTFLSTVSAEKKATLDDVVSSLNQLNIKLSQLVETNIDIGSKQIRAVQSNSRNLFERF